MATPDELRITAQAALDAAPDEATGSQWLSDAFSGGEWDDPEAAKAVVSEYGQKIKQKFHVVKDINPSDIESTLPISLDEVPPDDEIPDNRDKELARIDKWKQVNNDYFDISNDPNDLQRKDHVQEFLPDIAEAKKRAVTTPSKWTDTAARIALGAVGPIIPDRAAKRVHAVLDPYGIQTPENLTDAIRGKYTNPQYDDAFGSTLMGAGSNVATLVGLSAVPVVGPVLAGGYLAAQVTGALNEAADVAIKSGEMAGESKAGQAVDVAQALALEGAAQGVMLLGGKMLIDGGSKLFAPFSKATANPEVAAAIKAGNWQAAKEILKKVLSGGTTQAVVQGGSRLIHNQAMRSATNNPNIPLTQGVGESAAVGALFGGAIEGGVAAREQFGSQQPVPAELKTDEQLKETLASPETFVKDGLDDQATNTDYVVDDAGNLGPIPVQTSYSGSEPVIVTPESSSFKTEDGNVYVTHPETGAVTNQTPDGTNAQQYDHITYIDPQTASHLYVLKNMKMPDGSTPIITTDGDKTYVKSQYVTDKLDVSDEPTGNTLVEVPTKKDPEVGVVPLQVSKPSYREENAVVHANHIGAPITEITPATEGAKVRSLGQSFLEDPTLSESFKESVSTRDPLTGDRISIFKYNPKTMSGLDAAGRTFVEKIGGQEAALNKLMSGDVKLDEVVGATNAGLNILKSLDKSVFEAHKAGDLEAASKMIELSSTLAEKLSRSLGTQLGQAVKSLDLRERDPDVKMALFNTDLFDLAVKQSLKEQGLKLRDVTKAREEIATLDKLIAAEESNPKGATDVETGKLDTKALSPEQEAKLEALRSKKKMSQKQIESAIDKAQEQVNTVFPPEERVAYRKLIEQRNHYPRESKPYKIFDTLLKKKAADIAKKLGGGWANSELIRSYYINSLLGGLGTPLLALKQNIEGGVLGGTKVALRAIAHGENPVKQAGTYYEYLGKTAKVGARDALNVLQHGGLGRFEDGFPDLVTEGLPVFNLMGYAGRAVGAADALTSRPIADAYMAAQIAASPEAKYLSGIALREHIDGILYGTGEKYQEALDNARSAAADLRENGVKLSETDILQMAEDTMYTQRPQELRESGERFSQSINLMKDPTGDISKWAYEQIKHFTGLKINAFGGMRPLRWFNPFARAAINFIDLTIEHTPVIGNIRAATLENLNAFDRGVMHSGAVSGALFAGVLHTAAQSGAIILNGAGPKDKKQRDVLIAQGHKFNSFQWSKDGPQYSFQDSFLAPVFSTLAAYQDYKKYAPLNPHPKEEDLSNYIANSLSQVGFNIPMLGSLQRINQQFVNAPDNQSFMTTMGEVAKTESAEFGANFIPFRRMIRDIGNPFYDPIESKLDFKSKLLSAIPFVQPPEVHADLATHTGPSIGVEGLEPALNVFAQPIKARDDSSIWSQLGFVNRFRTQKVKDPDLRFLAEKGYGVDRLPWRIVLPERAKITKGRTREEALGADFAGMFTKREAYEIQKIAGPQLKQVVSSFRQMYADRPYSQHVQEALDKRVSNIYRAAKNRVLYSPVTKYNPGVEIKTTQEVNAEAEGSLPQL